MKKIIIGIIVALGLWIVARPTVVIEGTMANTTYTQADALAMSGMYIALGFVLVSIYIHVKKNKKKR